MKAFGIVLIVLGIVMIIFTGFNFQTKKNIVDAGPIQIDKKETKHVGWPAYTGGIAVIAGLVVLVAGRKK